MAVDERLGSRAIIVESRGGHLLFELANRRFRFSDARLERLDALLPRLHLARFLPRVRIGALFFRV